MDLIFFVSPYISSSYHAILALSSLLVPSAWARPLQGSLRPFSSVGYAQEWNAPGNVPGCWTVLEKLLLNFHSTRPMEKIAMLLPCQSRKYMGILHVSHCNNAMDLSILWQKSCFRADRPVYNFTQKCGMPLLFLTPSSYSSPTSFMRAVEWHPTISLRLICQNMRS
ncbi:hypothetical protein EDC04DRAFT_2688172 [Pisolithus marmoratus]|nr:hypothetical protein EDC04DRAFT_2688172 [Pisolithus marmoratus]